MTVRRLRMRVPVAWEDRECRDTPLELWFGPYFDEKLEDNEQRIRRESYATQLCGRCRIQRWCLDEELSRPEHDQWGVRGGLTAGQRREVIRARKHERRAV